MMKSPGHIQRNGRRDFLFNVSFKFASNKQLLKLRKNDFAQKKLFDQVVQGKKCDEKWRSKDLYL